MNGEQILRIRLKSFDHKLVDQAAQDIYNKVKQFADSDVCEIRGPLPLPTRINRWTVLRSPHVNKKSREQFERRTHQRLIDIVNPTEVARALGNLELPAGVKIGLKVLGNK